jgi:hypothetical protein
MITKEQKVRAIQLIAEQLRKRKLKSLGLYEEKEKPSIKDQRKL